MSSSRALWAGVLLVLIAFGVLATTGTGIRQLGRAPSIEAGFLAAGGHPVNASAMLGQLPLIFEPNVGQSGSDVRFMARGKGYGLFLTAQGAFLTLQSRIGSAKASGATVGMSLAGANPAPQVAGADLLPGKSNYIIGQDRSRWHQGVDQFARVRYSDVYPGVDLVYYGRQGRLEYDFEVAPGADASRVGLKFSGIDQLQIEQGNLVLRAGGRDVTFEAPRVYQADGNKRVPVDGQFVLQANNQVGFELGAYDRSKTLVIDPVLTYSTYLGGTGAEGCTAIAGATTPGCPAIAVDSGSNFYVAGTTSSADFPNTGTVPVLNGPADIFIAKFSSSGSTLLYSTFIGGSGTDTNAGVALDSGFNVFFTGSTDSTDFPTTANAFQAAALDAGKHAFVSELDSTGASLLYSTYISGSGTDIGSGIAVDVKNKAYIIGTTTSSDLPITTGVAAAATNQFFVGKIDVATSGAASVPYLAYFGGGNPTDGVVLGGGIAVDSNSNVYITGGTNYVYTGTNAATDFPILNAYQSTLSGPTDAFVAKINPAAASGAQLIYSTYLGGTGDETGYGVGVDSGGSAYVTGSTSSTDFTTLTFAGAFQAANAGGTDAFVAKIGPSTGTSAVSLTYFSYLGGTGTDVGQAIAVDTSQGARITGYTDSSDLLLQSAVQGATGGGTDAFAARLDTTATTATATGHYSTYLGGAGTDQGTGIAVDVQGASYIAGETTSANYPLASAFQGALGGPSDAFATKLGSNVNLSIAATTTPVAPDPAGAGNQVTFKYTVTNNGDLTTGITFTDVLPVSGATFVSATSSPGTCGAPTGSPSTVTCSVGTLNAAATATITVILTPTVAGPLGNVGTISVLGSTFTTSASATVTVNDYSISVAPASVTVTAGVPASYTVTVTPNPSFPNSISLSCSSGLPTGATCTSFSTNPILTATNGPVTSSVTVNTTARTTTTAQNHSPGVFYAAWLPVSGLAFLGIGVSGGLTRRRRWLAGVLLGMVVSLVVFQSACGSSSTAKTTTTGTPAGTYTLTISATSGSFSKTASATLIVQ